MPSTMTKNRLRRSVASPLLALTLTWFGLLVGYGTIFPLFEAPDELAHLDLVLFHEQSSPLTFLNDDRELAAEAIDGSRRSGFNHDPRLEAAATPAGQRPSFEDLATGADTDSINRAVQNPPLYYWTIGTGAAAVDWVLPGDAVSAFDRKATLYRFLAAVFLLPVPYLFALIARELGARQEGQTIAAFVPLLIPQLAHIGGALNNDDGTIVSVSLLTIFCLRIAKGALTPSLAFLTGLTFGISALFKGTALPLGMTVALALLWWSWREKTIPFRAGALVAVGSLVGGGWFWIRSYLLYGQLLQPLPDTFPPDPTFEPRVRWYVEMWSTWMVQRFFGWFGYFDVLMPSWAIWLLFVVFVASLLLGVWACRRQLMLWIITMSPIAATGIVLFATTFSFYRSTGVTAGIQGRYLFLGLGGVAATMGLGLELLANRSRHAFEAIMVGLGLLAIVVHVVAVRLVLDQYWEGDSWRAELATLGAWASYGATPTYLVLATAALLVLSVVPIVILLGRGADAGTSRPIARRA